MNQPDLKDIVFKALSLVPMFNGLPESALRDMAKLARIAHFKKDMVIFKERETGDKVYIIVTGLVKIYKQSSAGEETELKKALPCEVFGEMSLLDGYPRSANAKAMEDTLLFYIDRGNFMQFLKENPEAALKLLESMCHRLREANEIIISLTENNALNDLAAAITQEILPEKETTDTSGTPEESKPPMKAGDSRDDSIPDTGEDKERQKEWVYSKAFTCPLCGKESPSMVALSKHVQVEKTEPDMCTHYRQINPTFYYVIVCHHCGFAFPEDAQGKIYQKVAEQVQQQLPAIRSQQDFSGLRSIHDAVTTYRLAIQCQNLAGAKSSLLGRLFLRLSCLSRQLGLQEEDTDCLRQALELFEKAYTQESSRDPRGEINLIYLIGELHGHFGRVPEAIKWFNRVVTHPDRNTNSHTVKKARDRWQDFKHQNQGKP